MAYVGVNPAKGNWRKLTDISGSFNGVTTSFTLSVPPGGSSYTVTPASPYQLFISLGGIIQQPDIDFIVSTNTITFTTAPAAGLSFFGILAGDSLNIGTPSDATVTDAKVASNAAIAGTKISPNFGSQNIVTTGTLTAANISYPTDGSLSGRNRIINGDMRIDQRNAGASVTAPADGYAIDRWKTYLSGGGAMTVQRSTTAPAVFTNSQLFTVTTADTSLAATDAYGVQQMIEGFNSADLAWGTASASAITVSFWVRSSVTGTYTLSIRSNADTRSYLATYSISAANTFEYKTITIPGDTSGTWLTDNGIGIRVWFDLGAGSTYTGSTGAWSSSVLTHATGGTNWIATSGATFYITGVQLEAGSVATPFERRSYGQELMLCQRYYEGNVPINVRGANSIALAFIDTSGTFRVTKRAAPTLTLGGNISSNNAQAEIADNVSTNGFRYEIQNVLANVDTYVLNRLVFASAEL